MHRNYLLTIRHQPSKVVQRDRNAILKVMSSDIYMSYLSKVISYKDLQMLHEHMRNRLDLDSLFGIKQLSIFDEIPEEELHPQPEDMTPCKS